jgi:hypothetical protein
VARGVGFERGESEKGAQRVPDRECVGYSLESRQFSLDKSRWSSVMTKTFLQSCLLIGALVPAACASEEPPPFLLDISAAAPGADGGHVQSAGGATSASAGAGGATRPGPGGGRGFGAPGGQSNAGGAFGSGGRASNAGGAFGSAGRASNAGGGGSAGSGDGGGNPCPGTTPENGSACSSDGLRCPYRRFTCECAGSNWNCND